MLKYNNEIEQKVTQLAKVKAFINRQEAEMQKAIATVKEKYEEQSAGHRAEAEALTKDIEMLCLSNKEEFEKTRSKKFANGTVGFRANPAKILQLSSKFKVATTIEFLQKLYKQKYIRIKEEIDKEKLLADYTNKDEKTNKPVLTDAKLAAVGLRVEKDETFYIELDFDSLTDQKERISKTVV